MEDLTKKFVEDMLAKAGIDNMPADFKEEYSKNLEAQVLRRLGIMAISELDEAGVEEFSKLTEGDKAPEAKVLAEFFSARIPDFHQKVEETLTQFAQEFVSGAEKLKGTKLND